MLNRSDINRALSKAIAYKQCGKDKEAQAWACELIRQLEMMEILDLDHAIDGMALILEIDQ